MAFRSANLERLTKFNSAASSDFIDYYESLVVDEITSKNANPPHRTFAPSSFRCLRLNWFRIRGVKPDEVAHPDTVLDFSAQIGTACHEVIQRRLSSALGDDWINVAEYITSNNMPYSVQQKGYETLIESIDPPVRFACDGLIRWKDKIYLLEIKTSEFSSFDELMNPKEKHIDQVKAYCFLLNISDVLFLYQDRQYGGLKCFEYHVTDADRQTVSDKMKYVMDMVDACIAPEGLPVGDPQCSSSMCPYFKKCKEWGR